MKNPVSLLRRVGLVEGVSFLLLLGVAMPLKYIWQMPQAVKVVGWAHGILFVMLGCALLQTLMHTKWPLSRAALVFVAALLPFGPFLLEGRMKVWESEAAAALKE